MPIVLTTPSDSKSLCCVSKTFDSGSVTKHAVKKRMCEISFSAFESTPTISKCYPVGWATAVSSSGGSTGGSGSPGKVDVLLSMESMAGCSFCKPDVTVVGPSTSVGFPVVNVSSQSETGLTFSVLNIEPDAATTTRSGSFTCRIVLMCYETLASQSV